MLRWCWEILSRLLPGTSRWGQIRCRPALVLSAPATITPHSMWQPQFICVSTMAVWRCLPQTQSFVPTNSQVPSFFFILMYHCGLTEWPDKNPASYNSHYILVVVASSTHTMSSLFVPPPILLLAVCQNIYSSSAYYFFRLFMCVTLLFFFITPVADLFFFKYYPLLIFLFYFVFLYVNHDR